MDYNKKLLITLGWTLISAFLLFPIITLIVGITSSSDALIVTLILFGIIDAFNAILCFVYKEKAESADTRTKPPTAYELLIFNEIGPAIIEIRDALKTYADRADTIVDDFSLLIRVGEIYKNNIHPHYSVLEGKEKEVLAALQMIYATAVITSPALTPIAGLHFAPSDRFLYADFDEDKTWCKGEHREWRVNLISARKSLNEYIKSNDPQSLENAGESLNAIADKVDNFNALEFARWTCIRYYFNKHLEEAMKKEYEEYKTFCESHNLDDEE